MRYKSIRINARDLQVFDFIARFGLVMVSQLHEYLGGSLGALAARLECLVSEGYLLKQRIFYAQPAVYSISKKANLTQLSIINKINLSTYQHNLLVIDVFLKIRSQFSSYATERMIRAKRGVGSGKYGRIPDLIAYTAEGKTIALEVELSAKSVSRLQQIVATYATATQYDEVWFICATPFIYANLARVIWGEKIKLFDLSKLLADGKLVYCAHQTVVPVLSGETKRVLGKFFRQG